MIKKLLISLFVLTTVCLVGNFQIIASQPNPAGGGYPYGNTNLTISKSQAIADGNDSINIVVYEYMYSCIDALHPPCYLYDPATCSQHCGGGPNYEIVPYPNNNNYKITVSGSGNTLSQETFNIAKSNTEARAYINLKSAVAEKKIISVYLLYNGETLQATGTVEFVKAGAKKTITQATLLKLDPPVLATINSQEIPENKIFNKKIRVEEAITLSGTTIPDVTVKLYIYSEEPLTAEVKSGQDGKWSYEIAEGLPEGEHRVEAEVIDSAGNTSDRVEIAKFTIYPKFNLPEISQEKISSFFFTPLNYVLVGVIIVLIGLFIFIIIKRRRKCKNNHAEIINNKFEA